MFMLLRPPAVRLAYTRHDVRTHFGYGPNTADVEPANQDQASLGQIAQVLQHASLAQTRVRLGSATGLDSLPPEPSPSSPRKFDRAAPAFRRMNVAAGRALARQKAEGCADQAYAKKYTPPALTFV